jgi:hypothetical protein
MIYLICGKYDYFKGDNNCWVRDVLFASADENKAKEKLEEVNNKLSLIHKIVDEVDEKMLDYTAEKSKSFFELSSMPEEDVKKYLRKQLGYEDGLIGAAEKENELSSGDVRRMKNFSEFVLKEVVEV